MPVHMRDLVYHVMGIDSPERSAHALINGLCDNIASIKSKADQAFVIADVQSNAAALVSAMTWGTPLQRVGQVKPEGVNPPVMYWWRKPLGIADTAEVEQREPVTALEAGQAPQELVPGSVAWREANGEGEPVRDEPRLDVAPPPIDPPVDPNNGPVDPVPAAI